MSVDRPVVREMATVTVDRTVDGTRRRRPSTRRRQSRAITGFTVDPRIMAAARAALRPGERLVIVGPGEVRTTYR
jgi:hypothetical protein